jgi:hypothetical protein
MRASFACLKLTFITEIAVAREKGESKKMAFGKKFFFFFLLQNRPCPSQT